MAKKIVLAEPRRLTQAEVERQHRFTPDWPPEEWVVVDSHGTSFLGETAEAATALAKQFHRLK